MTTLREAAKAALEALEYDGLLKKRQAIAALRAALAQQDEPVREPVSQRKPLTQEDVDRICASLGFAAISPAEIVRAAERAHGIGERP